TSSCSDRLALIIESYVKEGLLIFTLKNIAQNFREQFFELDLMQMFSDMLEEEGEVKITEQVF
ncbi:MAG: hypothetical protein KIH08_03750, partial [Candidatus Freyarchaeota archaeon]|nr:hypothetical protein [Candidatus Jordarchaeia archaeon]